MAATATYSGTSLIGTNKTGKLPCDENGYYTVILGALDTFNSAGAYYPLEPSRQLLDSSSIFIRRVKSENLRGEYGHPKREPGQSQQEYLQRAYSIYEQCVSHHIADVWLDYDRIKAPDGRMVVAIMGKVRPEGPFGPYLKEQFENCKSNVCFSIRSLTDDKLVGGIVHKILKTIFTWDYVNEPGIAVAKKFYSPTLEAICEDEFIVTQDVVRAIQTQQRGIGNESGALAMEEILTAFGWDQQSDTGLLLPPSARW